MFNEKHWTIFGVWLAFLGLVVLTKMPLIARMFPLITFVAFVGLCYITWREFKAPENNNEETENGVNQESS